MEKKHGATRLLAVTLTFFHEHGAKAAQVRFRRLSKQLPLSSEWVGVVHCNGRGGRIHYHLCVVAEHGAAGEVVQAWWRRVARSAGFGRIECKTVRSALDYADYMSNGVAESRGKLPRGTRFFRSSATAQRYTVKFCWYREGKSFRKFVAGFAHVHGMKDENELKRHLGNRWSQRLWWAFDAQRSAKIVSASLGKRTMFGPHAVSSREMTETGKIVAITANELTTEAI